MTVCACGMSGWEDANNCFRPSVVHVYHIEISAHTVNSRAVIVQSVAYIE